MVIHALLWNGCSHGGSWRDNLERIIFESIVRSRALWEHFCASTLGWLRATTDISYTSIMDKIKEVRVHFRTKS